MNLTYVMPENLRNIIGLILLIATFTKIFLHLRMLKNNKDSSIENLLGNLFTAGLMIPLIGKADNYKLINGCVFVFYLAVIAILSQWVIR